MKKRLLDGLKAGSAPFDGGLEPPDKHLRAVGGLLTVSLSSFRVPPNNPGRTMGMKKRLLDGLKGSSAPFDGGLGEPPEKHLRAGGWEESP